MVKPFICCMFMLIDGPAHNYVADITHRLDDGETVILYSNLTKPRLGGYDDVDTMLQHDSTVVVAS